MPPIRILYVVYVGLVNLIDVLGGVMVNFTMVLVEKENIKIDLLMTDISMSKMNGRQLAEKLHPLYPDMKVLYTSGYTENVIAHHRVLDEGLNFIAKPYTLKSLAMKIRKVLDS